MQKFTRFALMAAMIAGVVLAAQAVAGDEAKPVTMSGKVVCAKCTLKSADFKECQNVLVVEEKGAKAEYYIAKNDVAEKFGHVCQGEKAATVTGTVAMKDGKNWITASKMEEKKG